MQIMEPDFVTELGDEPAVIEVKSGKSRKAPSIGKAARFFPVDRRIMLEQSNISVSEVGIEHYPMFAAAFLKDMENPEARLGPE